MWELSHFLDVLKAPQVPKDLPRLGGKISRGSSYLGIGLGAVKFGAGAHAGDYHRMVEGGFDTLFSGLGLWGGPIGAGLSAGYAAYGAADVATGWIVGGVIMPVFRGNEIEGKTIQGDKATIVGREYTITAIIGRILTHRLGPWPFY